ncbi:MAG: hypothetical protein MR885_04375 [Ruminococcus bromii]|nr:hypothetical protein [Ruminococcus bromii]
MQEKSNNEILNEFIRDFKQWGLDGKEPESASLDLNYAMDLQEKRMKSYGLSVNYDFVQNGENPNDIYTFGSLRDSGKFRSTTSVAHYKVKKTYLKNGKKISSQKDKMAFYAMITRLLDQNCDEVCCCPNCGAVSSIKTLLGGCPHCKTKFIITDLFPKVTNFFFIKDFSKSLPSGKRLVLLWIGIPSILVTAYYWFNTTHTAITPETVFSVIACIFLGAFGGYVLWGFSFMAKTLFKSFASIPAMGRLYSAKHNLPKYMKQIDSNFSYEYFVGKMFALIKMMIFSDDYENLAVYEGQPMQNKLKNVIDIDFSGVIRLNSFNVNGNYCYVDMNYYITYYIYKNNSVHKRRDELHIKVCRNIHTLQNPNFSLKRVECKSCGASFDATHEHNCPYCQSPYHLGDDDWVVLEFGKV